jgi:hypothetical protein
MFPLMFDRIMETSMALWLPVSAAYLIFLAGMIVRAFRHFRRARGVPPYGSGPDRTRLSTMGAMGGFGRETAAAAGTGAESRTRDWSPAR